nr:hypothetical protein CFP56_64724 [Quercus suber]
MLLRSSLILLWVSVPARRYRSSYKTSITNAKHPGDEFPCLAPIVPFLTRGSEMRKYCISLGRGSIRPMLALGDIDHAHGYRQVSSMTKMIVKVIVYKSGVEDSSTSSEQVLIPSPAISDVDLSSVRNRSYVRVDSVI